MTRNTMRDLERRLTDTPAGEPPADMLERLQAEIPPRLDVAPEPPRSSRRRLPPPWLRAAAVVMLALGGAWMLWRLSVPVLAPKTAVDETHGAAEAGGRAVERGDRQGAADWAAADSAGDSGAGRPPANSSQATASEEAVPPGGADVAQRSHPAAGDRSGGPGPSTEEPSATRPAAPAAESTPPPIDTTPSGSAPVDRHAELEPERPQALGEDPSAAREGTPVAGEAAELAEELAVVGQASKAEGSARSAEVAGAGRSPLASPPAPPAVAAPPARVEADDPDPLVRPLAAGSRVRSFVDTRDESRSTFPLHADSGSWELIRASLRRGRLPPAAAVRVEEVVNALDDGEPPPEPGETFRLTAEGTPSPFAPGPDHRLLRFAIRARSAVRAGRAELVAEEARVQVELDPRVVASWRRLGDENRDLADHRFRRDDTVDAGEIGAGHTVTALYEVRLVGEPPPGRALAHLELRYRVPGSDRFIEIERTLRVADLSPTWEKAPPSLRLAAIAAELAEQLRGTESTEGTDLADVAARAAAVAPERPGDERAAELADLAARAARLVRRP